MTSLYTKKLKSKTRHEFLLTFFQPESGKQEKWVNGFWLVKYFSNSSHKWEVAIYTEESFKRYKNYLNSRVPADKMSDSQQTTML